MNTHPAGTGPNANRRGMLLLMVLTMLSLFLLMGTLAIVLAIRSRESARAFAGSIAGPSQLPVIARSATDMALLTLLRGSTDSQIKAEVTESLLGDMYGTSGNARFVDEPWDAFDDDNIFLTRLALNVNGQVTSAIRPAFQKTGTNTPLPCEVDNDGDSVADGVWLKNVLPSMNLPGGGKLTFRVSYVVLDLDGRINVNAHGRRTDDTRGTTDLEGPADINASTIVGGTASWQTLLATAGVPLPDGGTSAPALQWRPAPTLTGQSVDGRFASGTSSKTYDLYLNVEATRPAMLVSATGQNPFTLGELERVLRQFDADSSTLPPRLAAVFGNGAERCRMRITTDSWDIPKQGTSVKWAAPNAGVPDEITFWTMLVPVVVSAGASQAEAEQWVSNIVEFRDKDTSANTPFPSGVKGVEPTQVGILGPWNLGHFLSPAQVLGVPMGTEQEIQDRLIAGLPVTSLAEKYDKILDMITVPQFFENTLQKDPTREPGRINVNTCDAEVWMTLINDQNGTNPFLNPDPKKPVKPAKRTKDLLMNEATFPPPPPPASPWLVTNLSHVFAVLITVEITNSSATDATPSCHRLFAIVDRSIPVTYAEGQNNNVRDMIRLQRFLN